ncbi:MAG TPA: hypothetical protein ENG48_02490 [Candidatus Atribacteria bacterium]|nr:hypothetical protein [Candidatus Atribacteria bacterium]
MKMKPATKINEFTLDIVEFCENEPYLYKELLEERERFLTNHPEKYYKTLNEKNWAEQRFYDYYIFSSISKYYEETPLEVFISKMLSKYNQQEQGILLGFKNHIFSGFTISKVEVGSYFMAKNLASGKEYKVRENQATHTIKEGAYIVGRIVPYETDYALSIINLSYPKESSYTLKRLWRNISSKVVREFTPLMIEKEIFQKNYQKINQEKNNLQSIEKKLKKLLKGYLGKKAPSIKNLRKKINRMTDPLPLIKELAERINFSSQEELNKFQQLFMDFWNFSPRDEFQGKSPQEIDLQEMGPQERELSRDLINYVLTRIKSSEFSDQGEIDKAIKIYQDKWLHQPQEELSGKTPWEAILEEREKLGNPRKDFSLSVSIKPVNRKIEKQINLSDIKRKNVPLVEDLEALVNYFRENRVKVTKKNRWIPFKYLKLIEEKFISPDKDNFNLFGKEEKRGEEPFKRYIYFIDLLSRAANFIYTDKRGCIQVNIRNFQEFTQRSYGEKVFELLLIWIEKLNWKKLQKRDFIAIYAENFQKIFTDILYLFYKYKVNEKIEIEEIVDQLYGSEIEKMEFPTEVMGHLTVNIELALLTYLKWLGVINTQKEILIPGTNLGLMKNFWVTPKGNKLINKLVNYYIRTGKIQ